MTLSPYDFFSQNPAAGNPFESGFNGPEALTAYFMETGQSAIHSFPEYQQWAMSKISPKTLEAFKNSTSGIRMLPNGQFEVDDRILGSDKGGFLGFDFGELAGPGLLLAGPFAGMMGAFGAAGAAGAAGAGAAEAGGLSAATGLTEAGWGMGAAGLGGDAAGLIGAGGTSLLPGASGGMNADAFGNMDMGSGTSGTAEFTGGDAGAGVLDPSSGLTEAGWNAGPEGLGGDVTAGATLTAEGAGGLDPSVGLTEAGWSMGPSGLGADAGGFTIPSFRGSSGGMNSDVFGNVDMGSGASGTEGFTGGDAAGTSLTDVPSFPTSPGKEGSGVPSDIMDKLLKYGPLALGAAGLASQKKAGEKIPEKIAAIGAPQRDIASQMLADAQAGRINAADQYAIDQWARNAIAQSRQYFAKAGISDSTMAAQSEADINARATAMKEQARQTLLKTGLEALNVVDKYQVMAVQAEMAGDQALAKQATDFLSSYGQWLRALPTMTGQPGTGTKPAATGTAAVPA